MAPPHTRGWAPIPTSGCQVPDPVFDLPGGLVPARRQARHFTQLVGASEADADVPLQLE